MQKHIPVMYKEVLEYLDPKPGQVIVDATVGVGGHTEELIKRVGPGGMVIGIDRDEESLSFARSRLSEYGDNVKLLHGDFKDVVRLVNGLDIKEVDAILYDLGISSFQLENPQRGFSFRQDGPLDMRMDRSNCISAFDLVNNLTEKELSSILREYGQERWHNRIAQRLVKERFRAPIATTVQLSEIITKTVPYNRVHRHLHPATRAFMALRIAVNRELDSIDGSLTNAWSIVKKEGRIAVISFHSLEDRIVKLNFRKLVKEGMLKLVTAKPLVPSFMEVRENRRARSAKFRVAMRV